MDYISSKDNKKIKYLHRLQQKKYRDQEARYVAEGLRAISDMINIAKFEYILIEEERLANDEYKNIVEIAAKNNIDVFVINSGLDHKIRFTDTPQGIWAVVKKDEQNFAEFMAKNPLAEQKDNIYILLDKVQDPGNLGTIIRTALAAGVKAIFLTKGSVDPYNPKTVRSTMSALVKLPIICGLNTEDVFSLMSNEKIQNYVLTPYNSQSYTEFSYEGNSLLILGNEGNGVSDEIIEKAQNMVLIPMYGDIESLNLSIAAALIMYKVRECKE